MREIRIPAFAKVNLCLDILGRRPDGYHELRTIFQTISLHDELRLRSSRKPGISLTVHGNETLSHEPIRNNLVYKAVDALRRELRQGRTHPQKPRVGHPGSRSGVEIDLHKKIPAGRGLGGGSSDAAAALLGYLRLTERSVPLSRLMAVASSLGADVPFFLFGGRALGIGKGDELYPLPDLPERAILIVSPKNIHVPTPDAYRWLKAPALTKRQGDPKLFKFCALCWSAQWSALSNDFERAVFQRHPRLAAIKRGLLRAGAAEASLAGSGSAVFGVFPSPALARRAAVGFPDDQAFVCETLSRDKYLRKVQGDVVIAS
jgi:4-diphosphocytidyl-2-C-methyl-D-erythritol kinase